MEDRPTTGLSSWKSLPGRQTAISP